MELTNKLAKQLKIVFGADLAVCVRNLFDAGIISATEARQILFA